MEYTEVLDKQIRRKQHYVPKAYLKNFSVSNRKSEQVYVVFANDENAKMVSIDNICCRSYLYDQIAIDTHSQTHVFAAPNEIENSFIELEGEYATIISKIKNALRDSDEFENVYLSMLANEFLKMNIAPDVGLFPRALAETMKESQLCIFKAKGSVFVTQPTRLLISSGEKDGIEYDLLGMPITPELFLAFVDTVQRVPRIIIIDDNSVKRMNSKQINKDLLISNRIDLLSYIDFSIDAEKEDDEQVYQLLHTDKETALKQYEDMMSSKEIKYWG